MGYKPVTVRFSGRNGKHEPLIECERHEEDSAAIQAAPELPGAFVAGWRTMRSVSICEASLTKTALPVGRRLVNLR
jgi:hypothetical protein